MPLTNEQRAKVAERLGKPADAPEDDLIAALIEDHDAQATDIADLGTKVTALSADVTTLKGERDTALSLSADAPRKPDALTLSMYADNIAAKRQAAVDSGAITDADAKVFDALLAEADGTLKPLALSASAGNRPFGFAFWDAVAKLDRNGITQRNTLSRAVAADPPHRPSLNLSGNGEQTPEQIREEARQEAANWQDRQLQARGLK